MIDFTLPSLGSDMDEGKLLAWHVKPGDTVKRGQVIAVVDTSKAAVDIEIWHDGRVAELLVEPGQTVAVGTVLARLDGLDPPAVAAAPDAPRERPRQSPAARKRAGELGIDITTLCGSGPGGAVSLGDVEAAAAAAGTAARAPAMRRAIAAAMSRSKRDIPHYYLSEPVPMRKALEWLTHANAQRTVSERLLMACLQLKALALALRKFPDLNGYYRNDGHEPSASIHIGVAISLRQGGLVAPALHDVDSKGLDELMKDLRDLVQRARAGSLRSSEMSDATITLSNLGDGGVESSYGVIYPPQVALVSFGRIAERPWVHDGALCVMPLTVLTLAADHRVSDGHQGALFLAAIAEQLQRPDEL